MQLTPSPRRFSGKLSLILLLCSVLTICFGFDIGRAKQQNTVFLPLKINSSRPASLQKKADATMARELAKQGLKIQESSTHGDVGDVSAPDLVRGINSSVF